MMASALPHKNLKKANSDLKGRNFNAEVQKALQKIDSIQDEIDGIAEQETKEIIKVEQKFNQLRKPHFDERAEIISNVLEFWPIAFNNHPDLCFLIEENEKDCFYNLIQLEVEEFEDVMSGYKISFYFKENPFFENTVLSKEFHFGYLGNSTSMSICIPIQWKRGMDLTTTLTERQGQLYQRSFFAWYNDHLDPTCDAIAKIIKNDLWLNPLQYFFTPDEDSINVNGVEAEICSDEHEGRDTETPSPAEPQNKL